MPRNRTVRHTLTVDSDGAGVNAALLTHKFDAYVVHGRLRAVRIIWPEATDIVLDTIRVKLYQVDPDHPADQAHIIYDTGPLEHGTDGVDLGEDDNTPVWNDHLGEFDTRFIVDRVSSVRIDVSADVTSGSVAGSLITEVDYEELDV